MMIDTDSIFLCKFGHLFHDPTWYKGKPLTECCPACKAISERDEERAKHSVTTRRSLDSNSMMQDDLGDLLRALGMFDGARPQSPHQVMREIIALIGEVKHELAGHFYAETDACRDRGVPWPCHVARAFGYGK